MNSIAQFAGEIPAARHPGRTLGLALTLAPDLIARSPGGFARFRFAHRVRRAALAIPFTLIPLAGGLLHPALAGADAVRYAQSSRLSAEPGPDTDARTGRQAPSLPAQSASASSSGPGPIPQDDPRVTEGRVTEGFIAAPLPEVWRLFTTADGHRALGGSDATVDLRIGGEIRSRYAPQDRPGGSETIVNEILAYDPGRMLALRIKQPPASFPYPQAVAGTWTVMYFSSAGENMTQVRIVGLGYGEDADSQAMRRFLAEHHRRMLDHAAKTYWPKCAACKRDAGEDAPGQ